MGKPTEEVVADLTRETASWRTIAAKVTLKQVRHVAIGEAPAGTTLGNSERYAATSFGLRKYGQYAPFEGREVCVRLGYTDGKRSAAVQFRRPPEQDRQRSITITRDFLDEAETGTAAIPMALPYYVGLVPIRTAIARAEPVGPGRVLDRPCTRYYFAGVAGGGSSQDLVYHLDDATSYPLAIESFANRERYAAGEPTTTWEARRFDEVQGRHVATDSDYTTFLVTAAGARAPMLTDSYHFAEIRFDDPIPVAAFWPNYEPGVRVVDRIAGTTTVPVPTPPLAGSGGATTTAASGPIDWAIGVGVALLGLALVLMVVGLVRRARASATP